MLGLIEKDLRLTLVRKQTILIFCIMALVMGMSMNGSFIIAYLTMLAMIISIGTISYDEFDNGYPFLMTLPFARKTYVMEKYVFCLCVTVVAWCFGVLVYAVGGMVRHIGIDLGSELLMLISVIPAMYISADIMIPLQLKYGSEKSRIVLFIIFGAIAVLVYGTKSFTASMDNPFASIVNTLDSLPGYVVLLTIIGVCAVVTVISYICSARIMEKKEF